jgi:hypothetical protein
MESAFSAIGTAILKDNKKAINEIFGAVLAIGFSLEYVHKIREAT